MSVLACFLHQPSCSRSCTSELSSRTWPTRGNDPRTHGLGKYPLCCTRLFFASVNSSRWEICLVNVQVFHCSVSHHAKISRMVLDLLHMSVSFIRNRVHKDSPSFGLIKEFLAHLCTIRIHSETFRRTSPTKPTVRESLPNRVRCQFWNSECSVHSRCCDHDVQSGQTSLSCRVLSTSRSSNSTRQRHCTSRHELLPPISELAVASADCTHHMRNVSWLQSLRRSFSLLEKSCSICATDGCPRFR